MVAKHQTMVSETSKTINFRDCLFYNTFLYSIAILFIGIMFFCRLVFFRWVKATNKATTLLACFLNQACAGLRPARAWFLKIDPVWIVGMRVRVCVCVSAPEAINN